jgi:hypothetical protein
MFNEAQNNISDYLVRESNYSTLQHGGAVQSSSLSKPIPKMLFFPEQELKLAEKGGDEILTVLKERRRIIGEFAIKILHNFSMLNGLG